MPSYIKKNVKAQTKFSLGKPTTPGNAWCLEYACAACPEGAASNAIVELAGYPAYDIKPVGTVVEAKPSFTDGVKGYRCGDPDAEIFVSNPDGTDFNLQYKEVTP